MPVEHSAGVVIFRKENNEKHYLLLHYPAGTKSSKDYWDLTKGHIEKGESELDAVKREAKEETGLEDLIFVEGFLEEIKYFYKMQGRTIFKTVSFYLAETKIKEIKISAEHQGFLWLPLGKAVEQLNFQNAKGILQKAAAFLSAKGL